MAVFDMSVPLWAWFAVLGVILVMLAVDLVAHRKVDAPRNRPILHPSVLTLRQSRLLLSCVFSGFRLFSQ